MQVIYGYLFRNNDEKDLTDYREIIRIMTKPTMYNNETSAIMKMYNILTDTTLPDLPDGSKFIDTAEYNQWYEACIRFFTDNTFITNKTYEQFNCSDVEDHLADNYVIFKFGSTLQFVITDNATTFKNIYPMLTHYYVVYDESQNISNDEMLSFLATLGNELGKDNIYTSVRQWNYVNEQGIRTSFYIYFSGSKPGDIICQEVVRTYLIKKYGVEYAKAVFPRLFISSIRKVFCLYDNKVLPIDWNMMVNFITEYNILAPEIIHVLDYISPIVVEYGVSDIYPTYKDKESTDSMNNKFLYYISSVLNYYNGKKLTKDFIEESQFTEHDDYCSVVTAGVEWHIMKKSYRGSYYQLDN